MSSDPSDADRTIIWPEHNVTTISLGAHKQTD